MHELPHRWAKFAYCSDDCEIRKYVQDKGLDTCGDCPDRKTARPQALFPARPLRKREPDNIDTI